MHIPCVLCLQTSILVLVSHVWTVAGYRLTLCLGNSLRKTERTNDEEELQKHADSCPVASRANSSLWHAA